MALKHLVDIGGSLVDISAYAPRLNWTGRLNAEEGGVGSFEVDIDDPLGELEIVGHKRYFIEDDESEDEDDIIFGGYTGNVTLARLASTSRRKVGPAARVITLMLVDANSALFRVTMKGADTDRDPETDVERMTWLLTTSEAATTGLDDVTTYVDTSSPVNMDGGPLRGTYFGQIIADCSQQSGKNFYAWWRKVSGTRTLTLWYGRDTLPDYESQFFTTNDRADLVRDAIDNGSAVVWPLGDDARLVKNYDRVYCGCYFTFGSQATYQHNATTHAASAHRDMTTNSSLVRTLTQAKARAIRQLADVRLADVRITTRLEGVPQHRVTLWKPGMLTQVKGTHWAPDITGWKYARILTTQPRPRNVGRTWDIDTELVLIDQDETSPGPGSGPFEGDVFAGLQGSTANAIDNRGPLVYGNNYDDDPAPGWYTKTTTGPISIDPGVMGADGTLVYSSITAEAEMNVRIIAIAQAAAVYIPPATANLNVRINGVIVGQDSQTLSGGGTWDFFVDLRNVHLEAGDVVSVDSDGSNDPSHGGSDDIFWTNPGINVTKLNVGRGTIYADIVGTLIFVGP